MDLITWMAVAFGWLLIILLFLDLSSLNVFGNDIVVARDASDREDKVEELRKVGYKPCWRVKDNKTNQVFLRNGLRRVHVLNCTDPEMKEFMRDVKFATARVFILVNPVFGVRQRLTRVRVNGGSCRERMYTSDQIKPKRMYLTRVNGENKRGWPKAVIYRYCGIRLGGDRPKRYQGYNANY